MRVFIKNFFFVTVPSLLVIFLMLELFFRFVIIASNTPNYSFELNHKVLKFDTHNNTKGTYTLGKWGEKMGDWKVNNAGWNYPIDYRPKGVNKRIAVIGDSYIEAFQVNNDANYPYLLNSSLSESGYEVYGFGISGAPLTQYLHMCRYVEKEFAPDIFIVNVVHNDFDESIQKYSSSPFFLTVSLQDSLATEVEPVPYQTSGVKKWMKKSALIRYLVNNLLITNLPTSRQKKAGEESVEQYNANVAVNKLQARQAEIKWMLKAVLKKFKEDFPNKRIIFVMDGCRKDIYDGILSQSNILFLNKSLSEETALVGLEVIDLNEAFRREYDQNKRNFEFESDGHWNVLGHQIVADTLAGYLKK